MGSVLARLEVLEHREQQRDALLATIVDELRKVHGTSTVIEQLLAYNVADRTENFRRGSHNFRDAPITHKQALFVRARTREMTDKQRR